MVIEKGLGVDEQKIPFPAGNQIQAVHRNQVILFTNTPVTAVCSISLAYKINGTVV